MTAGDVVQILGLAAIVAAAWLVAPALGLLVGGVALLAIGEAVDGVNWPATVAALWAALRRGRARRPE